MQKAGGHATRLGGVYMPCGGASDHCMSGGGMSAYEYELTCTLTEASDVE